MELQSRGERESLVRGLALCRHEDPGVRADAAFLLGQLGGRPGPFASESVPILRELLRHDPDAGVRSAAVASLGHLRAGDALAEVLEAVDDPEADVRVCAAFALGRVDAPCAVEGLVRLACDQDAEVRSWAALGLGMQGAASEAAMSALESLAQDRDPDVREEALDWLRRLRSGS
jgi:HEAT repeat protein